MLYRQYPWYYWKLLPFQYQFSQTSKNLYYLGRSEVWVLLNLFDRLPITRLFSVPKTGFTNSLFLWSTDTASLIPECSCLDGSPRVHGNYQKQYLRSFLMIMVLWMILIRSHKMLSRLFLLDKILLQNLFVSDCCNHKMHAHRSCVRS